MDVKSYSEGNSILRYLEEGKRLESVCSPGPWVEGYWGGQCHIDHGSPNGIHPGIGCVYDDELFEGYGNGICRKDDWQIYMALKEPQPKRFSREPLDEAI